MHIGEPAPSPHRRSLDELVRKDPLSTIITVSIDVLSASVAAAAGWWWSHVDYDAAAPLWHCVAFVPLVIALLGIRQVYRRRLNRRFLDEIGPIETTVALAAMLLLSAFLLTAEHTKPGATAAKIWICAAVLMPIGRLIRATIQRVLRRQRHLVSPTLIIGNGRVANQIIGRLRSSPEYGLNPVGLIDIELPWSGANDEAAPPIPYFGDIALLDDAIAYTGAEAVIIAFSRTQDERLTQVIRIAHRRGLRVWVVPRMFDSIGAHTRVEHVGGLPLLAVPHTNPYGWQFRLVKHVFDRVFAALVLLAISPLFVTLMVLVRLSSPGPIFFSQPRIGRDGQVFGCLKFRSMRPPRATDIDFTPDAGHAPGGVEGVDRRTKVGKIMRATSMDELPQLLNVLRGEMSLVGPRPERPEFVDLFEAQVRRYGERHRVKAGVTGWAQVHGLRGQTSIADRAEWDNYYIENWSLALDLKILALTVLAVLRRAE